MSTSEHTLTRIHPRHADTRRAKEHAQIADRYKPSARDIFAHHQDIKRMVLEQLRGQEVEVAS